jgi:FMN phosphatase YigB (HAD superfamily)
MKLALFDFDNTLFKTPYDENFSYMDKPESLSIRKWNFEPLLETINSFKNCKNEKDTRVILLTNRIDSLYSELKDLLEMYGLFFDDFYMVEGEDGDRSKGRRVKSMIKKYVNIDSIHYWEDKDKHIDDVKSTMEYFPEIELKINKVTI